MKVEIPDTMFEAMFAPFVEIIAKREMQKIDFETAMRAEIRQLISEMIREQKDKIIPVATDAVVRSIRARLIQEKAYKEAKEEYLA